MCRSVVGISLVKVHVCLPHLAGLLLITGQRDHTRLSGNSIVTHLSRSHELRHWLGDRAHVIVELIHQVSRHDTRT